MTFNWIGFFTIIHKELNRTRQVFLQAVLSPFLSTFLYFIVFGTAVGSRVGTVEGVSYGQFMVPGMIAMAIVMNAIMAASSGIYFLRFMGTINDLLTAPLSFVEIVSGFAIASALRTLFISALIYLTALFFVPLPIAHPFWFFFFLFGSTIGFSFFGLVLGIWAKDFEQLSFVPTIIITPLSFLGGVFYSLEMLPPFWRHITLFNPLYYLVSSLRYALLNIPATSLSVSIFFIVLLWAIPLFLLHHFFTTGNKIRN